MTFETRKQRYSKPDMTLKRETFDPKGRTWSRTLPRHCPWCRDVFYTFQAEGEEQQPFQTESEPRLVIIPSYKEPTFRPESKRQTCGHPLCEKASESEYNARDESYQKALNALDSNVTTFHPQPPPPRGGLRRAGQ